MHELGIKGRPMSQALAESHVGVWKRRFASWVRSRMDAVKETDEESRRAKEIKQSWPDLADTITASVNSAVAPEASSPSHLPLSPALGACKQNHAMYSSRSL